MDAFTIITKGLPIAMALIMFGLGTTLTVADFRNVVAQPKPVVVGLGVQIFLLPVVAVILCTVFKLDPAICIGMMILAASPGGVTANIFSHLAGGDVALNLTMTAINSLIAAVTLPLVTSFSLQYYAGSEHAVGLEFRKFIEVFALVIVPAAIGMVVNARVPNFSRKLDKPLKLFSTGLLALLVVISMVKEWTLISSYIGSVGMAVLLFNLISMVAGYQIPKLFKLPDRLSVAIAFEVGIHNGTLALYMAMSVLNSTTYAVPMAIYTIIMYLTATAFSFMVKGRLAKQQVH